MKATFRQTGETIVVRVTGKLTHSSHGELREGISRMIYSQESPSTALPRNIIFDFAGLEFVGSSGISAFIQALKEVSQKESLSTRCCNVGSEFKRIFKAFDEENKIIIDEGDSPLGLAAISRMDH